MPEYIQRMRYSGTASHYLVTIVIINLWHINLAAIVDELRNSHIPGGVYVAGVDDWRACVDSCQRPCTAVDFDQNDLSCWHHHGRAACSQRKVYQPGVNHYRTIACLAHHRSPLVSGLLPIPHASHSER